MPARLSIPALVASCVLVSCAAPRTSQGLLDMDGLPERVTVLNRPEDQQTVHLHVQKIEASQKLQELAEQSDKSMQRLHSAGRASGPEMLASRSRVAVTNITVIDAKLALARTGLLSASEPTMLDTDGDGLPDLRHLPLRVDQLLDQKLALSLEIFEQSKLGFAQAETLQESGVGSAVGLRVAARHMYEAKMNWLDAQMERDSTAHGSDSR